MAFSVIEHLKVGLKVSVDGCYVGFLKLTFKICVSVIQALFSLYFLHTGCFYNLIWARKTNKYMPLLRGVQRHRSMT